MTGRRYGFLCLLAAVCWTLTVSMAVIAVMIGIYSAFLGVSTVLTPSPTDEQDVRAAFTALVVVIVGAVALGLATVGLDVAVTVMSVRRIGDSEHSSAVPVLSLVATGMSTVAPSLLAALALTAGALEQPEVAAGAWWLLVGTVVVLAPCTRLAQLIGGIIDTATTPAPSRRPDVGPLP
ncbi:MAG: hypothetical protein ACTHWF_03335 [Brachybacterium sp.]|uniref:hypothetical protein n=1 Tax=Brachybacterium sp. Z12 TaxID=2759167 RepID=UPI001861AE37|nr:hypothetical protein [Brachybacterium sp. Z12]QNN82908.1 hypothetical protein H3H54_03405 [Brachybacterium sp. Z12]